MWGAMARITVWASAVLGLLGLGCGCSMFPATWRGLDPKADEQLRAMCSTLARADSATFTVRVISEELFVAGRLVRGPTERQVLLRRPDHLCITTRAGRDVRRMWFDGDRLTVLDVDRKSFADREVPGSIDNLLDVSRRDYKLPLRLGELLRADPYAALSSDMSGSKYLGRVKVGGIDCHYISVGRQATDYYLWIDAGKAPLPRRVLVRYRDGSPDYAAALDDWHLNVALPNSVFKPSLPNGSYRAEAFDIMGLP
jgi:hypothetical protein